MDHLLFALHLAYILIKRYLTDNAEHLWLNNKDK